jgi:hypothetical protein
MSNPEKPAKSVFEMVEGLTAVDPKLVESFQQAMDEQVIPEIVEVIQERRLLAADTRHKQLKS